MRTTLVIFLLLFAFVSNANEPVPTDEKATKETIKLYQNLLQLQHKGLMFGHQDDLAYGEGWLYEEGRSDVKDVCGDYPAVYGWELGHLELGDAYSLDSVHFNKIQEWIKIAYKRGGVNTISWHLRNPLTGGTSWDTSSKKVVKSILPGGEKHKLFIEYLDKLADFLMGLKTEGGTYIPVLFRPFHEHTGCWFWWGRDLCSVEEYTSLWKFTIDYLQNEKEIHHVLYSYSTDRFNTLEDYLERYPGDEIVDILAFDLYDRGADYPATLANCAEVVTSQAKLRGKVAAVSETGGPIATNTEWWTQTLLKTLRPYDLAYVLVWRNPWQPAGHGAFSAYKDSPDSEDFIQFYNDKRTLFQKETTLLTLYK